MDKKPLIDLDGDVLEGLGHLAEICGDEFIIVGAAARDILLQLHKIQPSRATRDADLAVRVVSVAIYEKLRRDLMSKGFQAQRAAYRFLYKKAMFDIMPFGDILAGKTEYLWPEDGRLMNMLGFDDAFRTAHTFRTTTDLTVRIASLASLVLLKVMAWNDRPMERPQDPQDIDTIMKNYLEAGNFDRLYDDHSDLTQIKPYTMERAGAALIGRDLSQLCSPEPLARMRQILNKELVLAESSRFFQQMAGSESIDLGMDRIQVMLSQMK